ncbi:efflux RND transporter periplasmic adaptor subunit [Piscibacillus salipiscarius]|uniref:Efflux RND transporter periplasmic adaptor subunit n=1 Tax=Piscibacillus salipiscarius TaxID=299480 RepID=A0ABW5QAV4_9BACI
MKKRRNLIFLTLFILVNFLLIYLDDDWTVDRITYVDEWANTRVMDVRENLVQDGILTHTDQNRIYFDKQQGNFQSFMVEKGDAVTAGDPLYTYSVTDYNQTYRTLTNEIDRLEDEVDAIEAIISEIERYSFPLQDDSIEISINDGEHELNIPAQGQLETEFQLQQFVLQKESELAEKEAQIDSLENQLDDLESTGDTITVESPADGIVSQLSASLDDPLMTISSRELHAYGELTEEQRQFVEEEMSADVMTETPLGDIPGTVTDISDVPEDGKLEDKSVYPLEITFNEEIEGDMLKPGYHVGLDITLKESLEAVVLKDDHIFDNIIWKMTAEGTLKKSVVTTGIEQHGWIEVVEGATTEDRVAYDPEKRFRDETTFITALDLPALTWYVMNPKEVEWERYLLMGLGVR